ncbi:MAG: hypothetical protein AMXMBFR4_13280 [Candidatus Hydrogenedentota bacterium]
MNGRKAQIRRTRRIGQIHEFRGILEYPVLVVQSKPISVIREPVKTKAPAIIRNRRLDIYRIPRLSSDYSDTAYGCAGGARDGSCYGLAGAQCKYQIMCAYIDRVGSQRSVTRCFYV